MLPAVHTSAVLEVPSSTTSAQITNISTPMVVRPIFHLDAAQAQTLDAVDCPETTHPPKTQLAAHSSPVTMASTLMSTALTPSTTIRIPDNARINYLLAVLLSSNSMNKMDIN
jgi:hypothetical protein